MLSSKLKLCISTNPECPTQQDGVAVVLNKQILQTNSAIAKVIVPGRAIQVEVLWKGYGTLRVLCIYAPANNDNSRTEFFQNVRVYYNTHLRHTSLT